MFILFFLILSSYRETAKANSKNPEDYLRCLWEISHWHLSCRFMISIIIFDLQRKEKRGTFYQERISYSVVQKTAHAQHVCCFPS